MDTIVDINTSHKLLKVKDLKDRYGIGNEAAYALVRRKDFPAFYFSGKFFIREDLLLKWEENSEKRTKC